ncbi:MAG: helix-turn-helix transcriptional regulator, partial [Mycobacterium sp.]
HVAQLCHPEVRNEFPPLRTSEIVCSQNLPVQLTSFVAREEEMSEVCRSLDHNRLVTLTGAGGVGKTRLAVEVAGQLMTEFEDGAWYVDLAAITDPAVVPTTAARTFGLPDQPGRSTVDILLRFISDRRMLLLLDNCEHLLDSCGELIIALLGGCPRLAVLTTSREPIGIAGEVTWRVPSLALEDEAVELFIDRAQRARPNFRVTGDDVAVVQEICRRLDGMPLAIELAAARVRALSLAQIVESLHDRFRLLTGGARTAVRRQQTLRASVDWSHELLTEPERVLFRRLGVFMGGFDLQAAQAVGAANSVEQYQVIDQLGLLVDKSLVVAEENRDAMRYRLLETVRQYALEKLGESSQADTARTRHRDHYTTTATHLDAAIQPGVELLMDWADTEIDNLRTAFAWSRETVDAEAALRLVSSLRPFWLTRGRVREGLAWFDAVLTDEPGPEVAPEVWARAVADNSIMAAWVAAPASLDMARDALATARRLDDPALIARALIACGMLTFYRADVAQGFFDEAIDLVRVSGDRLAMCQIRSSQAFVGTMAGDPTGTRAAAEEGRDLADEVGEVSESRLCRLWLGIALMMQGNLTAAEKVLRSVADDAQADHDLAIKVFILVAHAQVLAYQGQAAAAHTAADAALEAASAMGGFHEDAAYTALADAALASGDAVAAKTACDTAWRHTVPQREVFIRCLSPMVEAALACNDLVAARRWADDTVAVAPGWHQMAALSVRASVAIAQGEPEQAERDAHDALAIAARTQGYWRLPDTFECLARLASDDGNQQYAARLFGAAESIRHHTGQARMPTYTAGYDAGVTAVRDALGHPAFDTTWAEGAALSIEESIAYAQRGRGERKRPTSGWGSLTPTERNVVRLVSEGLANKDIATRLFVSPRTVQTHLTHVYTKLNLTSRVQLVQEAARHS